MGFFKRKVGGQKAPKASQMSPEQLEHAGAVDEPPTVRSTDAVIGVRRVTPMAFWRGRELPEACIR